MEPLDYLVLACVPFAAVCGWFAAGAAWESHAAALEADRDRWRDRAHRLAAELRVVETRLDRGARKIAADIVEADRLLWDADEKLAAEELNRVRNNTHGA